MSTFAYGWHGGVDQFVDTVGQYRERFRPLGLMGLYDEWRPGRPCSIDVAPL